jgi:hypothetical protein
LTSYLPDISALGELQILYVHAMQCQPASLVN